MNDATPDQKIVTLIASATEIVAALGLRERLVGVSHECDYPPDVRRLPHLSAPKVNPGLTSGEIDRGVRDIVQDGLSVYRVDVATLQTIAPDLIVTQDQCEVCAVSLSDVQDALCNLDLPNTAVLSLHPEDLDDIRADIRSVARCTGVPDAGEAVVADFDATLAEVATHTRDLPKPSVALVEWLDPPMVAGGWMPELAPIAGARPVIVEEPRHFETVSWDDIAQADPDYVVILPCGFDVPRSMREIEVESVKKGLGSIRAIREGRGIVVDGNAYFNRPGPRIADSAAVLAEALHPGVVPDAGQRYGSAITRLDPAQFR